MSRSTLLVAMRSDLARVAREEGRPRGYAPSIKVYGHGAPGVRKGRFSVAKILAELGGGWQRKGEPSPGNPRISWAEGMRRMQFRVARELMSTGGPEEIVADLRRVALEVRRPMPGQRLRMPSANTYRRRGAFDVKTVIDTFGSYNAAAEAAHLEPNPHGGAGKWRALRQAS